MEEFGSAEDIKFGDAELLLVYLAFLKRILYNHSISSAKADTIIVNCQFSIVNLAVSPLQKVVFV